jgi:hypothetical protein
MNTHTRYPTAAKSPREKRRPHKYDFTCKCGLQWDAPGYFRMYCTDCGETVEAE